VHRTARWSALVIATAAFMTTACRRDDSQVDVAATDSSLARDITLASAVTTPTPQLRDSPDSAPPTAEAPLPKPKVERKPPRPTTQPRTPERTPPKPESPAPTPTPSVPPEPPSPDAQLRATLDELLVVHDGNIAAVARALGKNRNQIHRWARRLGLDLTAYRRRY